MNFSQTAFSGGMNQKVDATRISRNEYALLINGRTRFDVVEAIASPVSRNFGLPLGNLQGLYGIGQYLIVFVDGRAFYLDCNSIDSGFKPIQPLQMSATATRIYATAVPGSTVNYKRLTDGNFSFTLGSPQCLVVQDGVSQPWVIFPDATTRKTLSFDQWYTDNREYVPIGTQMLFSGSILNMVAASSLELFHSVSGRPLDFMVNLKDGEKGGQVEKESGAESVSNAVATEPITCLAGLNSPEGEFFVSTLSNSYIVRPRLDRPIFNEPTYDNITIFPTGVVGPFAFTSILGDSVFIDQTGIRSFNAVLSLKNEGRNSAFSKSISGLFKGVTQSGTSSVGSFDNYSFFSVDTVYGPAVVVFDELGEKFVSVDIYEGVAKIKQFAEIKLASGQRMFFAATVDNKVFQLFASETNVERVQLYLGEFCSNDPNIEQKPQNIKVVFTDIADEGSVDIKVFTDRVSGEVLSKNIAGTSSNETLPLTIPFGSAIDDNVDNINFDLSRSRQGWKVGVLISWQLKAVLSHASYNARDEVLITSIERQAQDHSDYVTLLG